MAFFNDNFGNYSNRSNNYYQKDATDGAKKNNKAQNAKKADSTVEQKQKGFHQFAERKAELTRQINDFEMQMMEMWAQQTQLQRQLSQLYDNYQQQDSSKNSSSSSNDEKIADVSKLEKEIELLEQKLENKKPDSSNKPDSTKKPDNTQNTSKSVPKRGGKNGNRMDYIN